MLPLVAMAGVVGGAWLLSRRDRDRQDDTNNNTDSSSASGSYQPTLADILKVKATLLKGCRLPIELVDVILDEAEYWAHSTALVDFDGRGRPLRIPGGSVDRENRFLLRCNPMGFTEPFHSDPEAYGTTAPEPRRLQQEHAPQTFERWAGSWDPPLEHPCRKIVFTTKSHDQGYSSSDREDKGTYRHSWTWFDVGLERFDAEDAPQGVTEKSGAPELPLDSLRPIIPVLNDPDQPPQDDSYEYKSNFHWALLPGDMAIQRNVLSSRDAHEHRVEWRWTDCVDPESAEAEELDRQGRGKTTGNGEFVRNLKLGDVVTVWGKARFGAWVHTVYSVRVDVYWAI